MTDKAGAACGLGTNQGITGKEKGAGKIQQRH